MQSCPRIKGSLWSKPAYFLFESFKVTNLICSFLFLLLWENFKFFLKYLIHAIFELRERFNWRVVFLDFFFQLIEHLLSLLFHFNNGRCLHSKFCADCCFKIGNKFSACFKLFNHFFKMFVLLVNIFSNLGHTALNINLVLFKFVY